MAINEITRAGILSAIAEFDGIGQDAFLSKYRFGRAHSYFLVEDGKEYDSKAIVGAAHAYVSASSDPLTSSDFNGGDRTVQPLLERLGFVVENRADSSRLLPLAGEFIEYADAQAALAGYAFAPSTSRFKARKPNYGSTPEEQLGYKWAYRSYDCVQGSTHGFQTTDILVIDGLNGQLRAASIDSLLNLTKPLGECFDKLNDPATISFWKLSEKQLESEPSETDGQLWWMYRAWWLLMSAVGSEVAVTHKILHHRRPDLFPLIDNKTIDRLNSQPGDAWQAVRSDLQNPGYVELARWFDSCRKRRGDWTVQLQQTRIHDILLWLDEANQLEQAIAAGSAL